MEQNQKNRYKLSVSGGPGCGSSRLATEWAQLFGWATTSAGTEVREMVRAETGGELTPEYERRAWSDPNIDNKLDQRMAEFMRGHEKCVLDWRLAWHFCPEVVTVLMERDELERMWLIQNYRKDGQGKSIRDLLDFHRQREEDFTRRFRSVYGIENFRDRSHYDIVVDVSGMSVEQTVAFVVGCVQEFLRNGKRVVRSRNRSQPLLVPSRVIAEYTVLATAGDYAT